jgi:hypothetical protein
MKKLDELANILNYPQTGIRAKIIVQELFDGYILKCVNDSDEILTSLANKITNISFDIYSHKILIRGDYITCFKTTCDFGCRDEDNNEIEDLRHLLLKNNKLIRATLDLSSFDKRLINVIEDLSTYSNNVNSNINAVSQVNNLIHYISSAQRTYVDDYIVPTPISVAEWLLKHPDPFLSKRNYSK